jgi:NADH dehydrogenase
MKKIVIIGAGFGGLAAAKALRHASAEICVIDRANHSLFQPLLYQVATTVLSPAQIASPIRQLLKNQGNTAVFLGEVSGIRKLRLAWKLSSKRP